MKVQNQEDGNNYAAAAASEEIVWDKFNDDEVRFGFIRKVYGILSVQLTFTALFCLVAMYVPAI